MRTTLSIVLLVRHSADALGDLVADCLALAARHSSDYELILVTDGADPAARARANALAATHGPVLALQHSRRGTRAALRDAWSLARGQRVLAFASDQARAADAARLLAIADGYDLVVGMRRGSPITLLLATAGLHDLIAPTGGDRVVAELAAAANNGLALARVELAFVADGPARGQRAALGIGALIVAGWLWLLRRRGSGGRS